MSRGRGREAHPERGYGRGGLSDRDGPHNTAGQENDCNSLPLLDRSVHINILQTSSAPALSPTPPYQELPARLLSLFPLMNLVNLRNRGNIDSYALVYSAVFLRR